MTKTYTIGKIRRLQLKQIGKKEDNMTTTKTETETTTTIATPVIKHGTPALGVPIPVSKRGKTAKPYEDTYGFDQMQVGALLVFNCGSKEGMAKVRNAASVHKKHTNGVWNFTSRDLSGTSVHGKPGTQHPDYTVGVWRMPEVIETDAEAEEEAPGPQPVLEVPAQTTASE